jgi:hypothetical protein
MGVFLLRIVLGVVFLSNDEKAMIENSFPGHI